MGYPTIPSFPVGVASPNAWVITISSGPTGVDLTTVTAVTLDAFRTLDLSRATWTPAILAGATASSMNVSLAFTGAEITTLGPYEISVTLTVPGGLVPSSAIACIAVDAHVLPPTLFLPGASTLVTPIAGIPGLSGLAAHAVLLGTSSGSLSFAGPGSSGLPLLGGGASVDPSFGVLQPTGYVEFGVADAPTLALQPVASFAPGTRAYVTSLLDTFYFDPANADAIDSINVIGTPTTGRWIRLLKNVYLRPIDGVSDDWPRLNGIMQACAYKAAIWLLPGLSGQSWICKSDQIIPNGTVLYGTPGTTVVQTFSSGAQIAFTSNPGSAVQVTTIVSSNVPGSSTLSIASLTGNGQTLTVGSVVFANTNSGQRGNFYTITKIIGGGPYTITLDRPVLYSFANTDKITVYPNGGPNGTSIVPQDIYIFGNGMRITGTGLAYVLLVGATRCHVRDVHADGLGGQLSVGGGGIGFIFDTGSFDVSMHNVRSVNCAGVNGLRLASVERGRITDSWGSGSQVGISLTDSIDFSVMNCYGSNNSSSGLISQSDGGSVGSSNGRVVGGSYCGNTTAGIWILSGSFEIDVDDVHASGNGTYGVLVDVTSSNIRLRGGGYNNNVYGTYVVSGAKGTVVDGVDLSNNTIGIQSDDSVAMSNLVVRPAGPGGNAVRLSAGISSAINLQIQSANVGWQAVAVLGGNLSMSGTHISCDDASGFSVGVNVAGGVASFDNVVVDGAASAGHVTGIQTNGGTALIGINCALASNLNPTQNISGTITFVTTNPSGPYTLDTVGTTARFFPVADTTGSVGLATNRWGLIRGVVVASGDLDLCDEENSAHWTLREEPDCIVAVNRMTDEWYKIPMVPLTPEERAKYGATPLKSEALTPESRAKVLESRAKPPTPAKDGTS